VKIFVFGRSVRFELIPDGNGEFDRHIVKVWPGARCDRHASS
jgi:hypothetical protein